MLRRTLVIFSVLVLVVWTGFCMAGEVSDANVVFDLYDLWLRQYHNEIDVWTHQTILDMGRTFDEIKLGALFQTAPDWALPSMFEEILDENQRIERLSLLAHPAWQQFLGYAVGSVTVMLPDAEELYLTYYPGKMHFASDGVNWWVYVNDEEKAYHWTIGEAGWKDREVIDLSMYAGQEVIISFKVGWGKEELGEDATTAYDSLLIGNPCIVRSLD